MREAFASRGDRDRPAGVPSSYADHARLMFDLQVLAFQADITRVITFQLARETSNRTYPEIGVPDPHHPLTHHGNRPEVIAELRQLVADLQAEYGEHQYGRIDLHIPDDVKNAAIARAKALKQGDKVGGMPILRVETLDGVKFYLDNPEAKTKPNAAETWILFRASGTEPLMRIYTESTSKEAVAKLLEAGRAFAMAS